MSQAQQTANYRSYRLYRWLILSAGILLLLLTFALVILTLRTSEARFQGDLADHIMTTLMAAIFCLSGTVAFLRLTTLHTATVAFGVFIGAALIFCLLNISAHRESVIAMSLLSILVYGLATTFVCQFAFPSGWRIGRRHLSPSSPLVLSLLLCCVCCPALFLFPSLWIVATFLIYLFPFACMLVVTWGIVSGLHRAAQQQYPVDGMTLIGIVLVLLSLAIITAKSTPYEVSYLPSTVGFLIFYCFFVACVALSAGIMFWAWRRLVTRVLQMGLPLLLLAACLLLVLQVKHPSDLTLVFLAHSLQNLFVYHLLSLPLLLLPIVCCYALIYHQLARNVGVLSRHFIRGTLWFILASCFVALQIIVSILAEHIWPDHSEAALLAVCWLFLSLWLFPLLWNKIRDSGDRMFYRDFYHYNRTLRDLSLALTRFRDLNAICAFMLPRLTTLLNASATALFVWDDPREPIEHWQCYQYESAAHSAQEARFKTASLHAMAHLSASPHQEPQLLNGVLLLPLYDSDSLRGCLCLGSKLNGEPYSRQDRSFLETLAAQLAVLEASTRYLAQVHSHAQQVSLLNRRIIQAQEEERHRLALELHDDALQQSMLLTRQLTDLGDSPHVARALPLARAVTSSLRSTCLQLRPPLLSELGLPEALRWLVQQTARQSGLRILFRLHTATPFPRLTADVELTLYRVAQEALSNALKHAEATLVFVRLCASRQGRISLLIVDNGRGLQRSRPLADSLGLTGMLERVQAIGGMWSLRSNPGRGVAVRALYQGTVPETTYSNEVAAHEYSL